MNLIVLMLAFIFFLPIQSRADLSDLFKAQRYDCYIIGILDSEDGESFEFDFSTQDSAKGSHGGDELTFTYKNHEVVAIANHRWLGISWWIDDKKVGEAVTVSSESSAGSRVILLINPSNENERVSATCDLNTD